MTSPLSINNADGHKIAERRRLRRKETSLNGRLVYGLENHHVDCTIRDFNENGARVAIADTRSLPDSVTLLEPNNLMAYDATTVWRCGNLLGLSFNQAFSLDSEEVIRLSALRQLTFELKRSINSQ